MSPKTLASTLPPHLQSFEEERENIHRQMLSTVSHDLKTPLAAIIGSLEVCIRMNETLSKEKRHSLIHLALMESYRLDNFITNILDMAKLENGMVKTNTEPCDLNTILQDCLSRLGSRREKGDITLRAVENNVSLYTDPMLLGRAIGILLENALKHAGTHPAIVVKYGVANHHATIRVHDNGPGIPLGEEEAIFSKYTRLSSPENKNNGVGLGLAICKHIMQTLGGDVTAENHPTGGAIFTLTLPVA